MKNIWGGETLPEIYEVFSVLIQAEKKRLM